MSDTVKLYDLTKDDFPRSQTFRSLQVYECPVCGALTNSAYYANCIMGGARMGCPLVRSIQGKNEWHKTLALKRELLRAPHPASYKSEMEKEIEESLRVHADKIINDIVGSPDFSQRAKGRLGGPFITWSVSNSTD